MQLLVSQGWSPEYVMDEIPLDVFQRLVLTAYKMKQVELRDFGTMFLSCLGAMFNSDKNYKPLGYIQDSIDDVDSRLRGGEEQDGGAEVLPTRRVVRQKLAQEEPKFSDLPVDEQQKRTMHMLGPFMRNFNKFTGNRMSLGQAINKAQQFQKQNEQLRHSDGD